MNLEKYDCSDDKNNKFHLFCPKCNKRVYPCPDPACEGMCHHYDDFHQCDEKIEFMKANQKELNEN